jgi:eukaryotic-like serine/threonine-protein kinase
MRGKPLGTGFSRTGDAMSSNSSRVDSLGVTKSGLLIEPAPSDSSAPLSDESAVSGGDSRSCEYWDFDGVAVQMAESGLASRYRVVAAHAKGGLGEIYLAEDAELHRRVALKEIQPKHAANPVSRERFVIEAEITGNLEHPGIVPVYGMGTYPDGRPFYAMRFVKGEDLGTAIRRFHAGRGPDLTGLEFHWLLRRFVAVCNTVAYAHSRGVLHRDLKPSNIMLGPFGETLVLDWGVAKLMGNRDSVDRSGRELPRDSTEAAICPASASASVTLTGQAVGTPAYMSPEQAAGKVNDLGPSSDVYSLGATLYVLLTDRRPFDGEVVDVIRDVERGRFDPPRVIQPRVPKALDAICCKAMALDPSQRYRSALDLADDIERWLADEPVSAWPEPRWDRGRRWVRRHQPLVAGSAAAVVVALVALGLAVPLLSLAWSNESAARHDEERQRIVALHKAGEALDQRAQAIKNLETANAERARAQAQQALATEERDRAEKTLKFLVEIFRRPDPAVDGRSLKVVDLLDQATSDLERSLLEEPLMKATLYTALGETFGGLGMPQQSFAVFQRALSLRRQKLGDNHVDTLASLHNLAMAYQDGGRLDQAIPILEATLEKRRAKLGDDHADTIESMNDLAVAYWETGKLSQAIGLYESTLAKTRSKLGEDHQDTLTIADNLAVAYAAAGQTDRAIPLHEATAARMRSTLGDDHLATLIISNNLARAYAAAGRTNDSIELYETTVERLRRKLPPDHPTTLMSMHGLGRSYLAAGRLSRAIPLLEETLSKRRAKLGPDHPDTLLTLFALATARRDESKPELALALAREFVERARKIELRLPEKVRALIPEATRLVESITDQPPCS